MSGIGTSETCGRQPGHRAKGLNPTDAIAPRHQPVAVACLTLCTPVGGPLVGRSPTGESGKVVQARAGVAPRRRTFHRRLACPRPPPLAVQAVTSMNGGGGALAFRPTWLRLDEAVEILVERGVTSELAKASLRRAIASGQRVRATGGFEPFSKTRRIWPRTSRSHDFAVWPR